MPTKEVFIYDDFPPFWGEAENVSVEKLKAWLDERLLEIPEEFRGTEDIDFSPIYEHGEHYANISISYRRPMTPDEIASFEARHDEERQARIAQLTRQIEKLRATEE